MSTVEQDTRMHERLVDAQYSEDQAWDKHAEWLASVLVHGGTVHLNRRPYLTPDDLFEQMCHDSMSSDEQDKSSQHLMNAIKCRPEDEVGCGALIQLAKKVAATRLIEAHDKRLRDQFEEGFMEHYAKGAA